MTVKELYELARKRNIEDISIQIGTYDEDGWYDEFDVQTDNVFFDSNKKRIVIAL